MILVGRLGTDPDIRTITSGETLANLSIATSEKFKKQSGETIERTEWHRCVAWSQIAEFTEKYLHKGNLVYLEGKLQTRKWQDKAGNDRYTTEVKINKLTSLGSKKDNSPKTKPDPKEDDLPDFLKELDSKKSSTEKLSDNEDDWPF